MTRLEAELEALAGFSDAPAPAVTRVVYSDADRRARAWLRERFETVGLRVRSDPLGTTFARWHGLEPELPAVATGSHVDAIPHAGRYDGTVGVLGALEAIRRLRSEGYRPRRSVELVLFTSEEPTRFGIGCLGSRAMAGSLGPAELEQLEGPDGITLDTARRAAGFDGPFAEARLAEGHYHAFVELHIEQGPVLERERIDVAAVTAIAAPATLELTLTGEGGHAGAVRMAERRDALPAAAEIALAVEAAANESGNPDSVATVGILDLHPRAVNSIPARAVLSVDARDTELARRDRMIERIRTRAHAVCDARGIGLELTVLNADPPANCAPDVVAATERAAAAAGPSCRRLVSRAYHDALFMARICPSGMIFIPCRNGVSHRPDEHAEPDWIDNGVTVLAGVLRELTA